MGIDIDIFTVLMDMLNENFDVMKLSHEEYLEEVHRRVARIKEARCNGVH